MKDSGLQKLVVCEMLWFYRMSSFWFDINQDRLIDHRYGFFSPRMLEIMESGVALADFITEVREHARIADIRRFLEDGPPDVLERTKKEAEQKKNNKKK